MYSEKYKKIIIALQLKGYYDLPKYLVTWVLCQIMIDINFGLRNRV
ncbi:MAG: hypothetical protein JWP78_3898 [Mucilaginibacter sp.]|nr:hypothetical protein [Mucilaginibacter sp.]